MMNRLKRLKWMVQTYSVIEEEQRVEEELRNICKKLEIEAWPRCRPFILRDRDKNTSYFHYTASYRFKRNKVFSLLDSDSKKVDKHEHLLRDVMNFYAGVLTSSRPPIDFE